MEQKTFFSKFKSYILLFLFVVIAGSAYFFWPKTTVQVQVVKVSYAPVERTVSSSPSGEFVPKKRVLVRAEISGKIKQLVYNKPGMPVRMNQVIVSIDDKEQRIRMSQARIDTQSFTAQMRQTEIQQKLAESNKDRLSKLDAGGAATLDQIERASAAVEDNQALGQVVRLRKNQAARNLELAKIIADNYQIKSPFDGILTDVLVEEGAFVTPGTPLFEVMDVSSLYVKAPFDGTDISSLKIGQRARLQLDDGQEPLWGVVTLIEPALKKDLKGARTGLVEIAQQPNIGPSWSSMIRPFQSVSVEIIVEKAEHVLTVPIDAIIGRVSDKKIYVLHKEQEGFTLKLVPVEIGLQGLDVAEVKNGLVASDLILSPKELRKKDKNWSDGMRVVPLSGI